MLKRLAAVVAFLGIASLVSPATPASAQGAAVIHCLTVAIEPSRIGSKIGTAGSVPCTDHVSMDLKVPILFISASGRTRILTSEYEASRWDAYHEDYPRGNALRGTCTYWTSTASFVSRAGYATVPSNWINDGSTKVNIRY